MYKTCVATCGKSLSYQLAFKEYTMGKGQSLHQVVLGKLDSPCKPMKLEHTLVKNPLAIQETRVRSLGQEDPLEKEMATHSSNPA